MEIPIAPLRIRSSIIARMGAIPVPGPTKTQETGASGILISPFTNPTGISVPKIRISAYHSVYTF